MASTCQRGVQRAGEVPSRMMAIRGSPEGTVASCITEAADVVVFDEVVGRDE